MDEKNFTRLTLENGYGRKITIDEDHNDVDMHDLMHMFYSALIGVTWLPQTIIDGMEEFVEDMRDVFPGDAINEDN